jgi:HEAT repeat protein
MPLFGPPNINQLEAKRDAQGLIKALAFKDAAIRQAAAEALAPLKDPAAVEPLTALLEDESAGVRGAAASALVARGGFRVVEPLVRALENTDAHVRAIAATAVYKKLMTDPDAETRRATATALGRIRAAEGVEPLLKAIKDSDEAVRVASIRALQAIGDVQAVMPLVLVVARESSRARTTGRSDAATERAASQALEILCDERAIEPLRAALANDDPDVREIAVRRLARIGTPAVVETLTGLLAGADPPIRRAAARGLGDIDWQPAADETGARYWAALREWRRCAESGPEGVAVLVSSFDGTDAIGRSDILAALAGVDWQPDAANTTAALYWASRGRWDKCTEMGQPAVEALESILLTAPRWRTRVEAAAALATLEQPRTAPFARLDLVRRALAILDAKDLPAVAAEGDESDGTGSAAEGAGVAEESAGVAAEGAEGAPAEKRARLEAFMVEEHQFDPEAEAVEFCKCGYPATRTRAEGSPQLVVDLLGFESTTAAVTTYYCPSCDTRRGTIAG